MKKNQQEIKHTVQHRWRAAAAAAAAELKQSSAQLTGAQSCTETALPRH